MILSLSIYISFLRLIDDKLKKNIYLNVNKLNIARSTNDKVVS